MNKIKSFLWLVPLLVGKSFALPIRVEIGKGWRELHIACSTPFSLKNLSNGEFLNSSLNEARFSFLTKTRKTYFLRFNCPNEEIAQRVEREVKLLGYDVERNGRDVVARCELQVGKKVLQERIKGKDIITYPFEKELEEKRLEVEIEGKRMVFPCDARLRLAPIKDKGQGFFAVSIDSAPSRRFRGELEIFVNNASLSELVNELDLEDYLRGVLPAEIPSHFPTECLKAQAVVARTYAVYSLGRHKKEGFDLCGDRHCQIYLGYDYEKSKFNDIIEATKGIIVTYKEKPALTPFHSCCGGIGEDASLWGASAPYLIAKPDNSPYPLDLSSEENLKKFLEKKGGFNCELAPDFRWIRKYGEGDLQEIFSRSLPLLLRKPTLKVEKIKDISVDERSPWGRVRALKIETKEGIIMLRGDEVRWAFGDGRPASKGSLPSLLFFVEKEKSEDKTTFKIVGGGSGHGIGFCQWGAVGLAKKGYSYPEIIRHYFPGTTLKNLQAETGK